MARQNEMRAILAEGRCMQGSGRAFDAAVMALEEPRLTRQLLECLWDENPGVASRAADALETVTRERPRLLQPWKPALLDLMAEARPIKLRWHLALTVTRLKLTPRECRRAAEVLSGWLDDRSSVVKTCAMQGLAELSLQDESLRNEATDLLRVHSRSGTPAMRARGRILLEQMEKGKDITWHRPKPQEKEAARRVR